MPAREYGDLIPFTERQDRVVREAQRHGLRDGYTLPIGVVGEPAGCCSFVTNGSKLLRPEYYRAASLLGAEAFSQARWLHGFPARASALPRLSRRKLECLRYLVIGKTDAKSRRSSGSAKPRCGPI